jgi:hypothetical protein
VCAKLGLLQDDGETWLCDAAVTQMCPQMERDFVELPRFCSSDPRALFDTHRHEWWDDFASAPLLDEDLLCHVDLERRLSYENKR